MPTTKFYPHPKSSVAKTYPATTSEDLFIGWEYEYYYPMTFAAYWNVNGNRTLIASAGVIEDSPIPYRLTNTTERTGGRLEIMLRNDAIGQARYYLCNEKNCWLKAGATITYLPSYRYDGDETDFVSVGNSSAIAAGRGINNNPYIEVELYECATTTLYTPAAREGSLSLTQPAGVFETELNHGWEYSDTNFAWLKDRSTQSPFTYNERGYINAFSDGNNPHTKNDLSIPALPSGSYVFAIGYNGDPYPPLKFPVLPANKYDSGFCCGIFDLVLPYGSPAQSGIEFGAATQESTNGSEDCDLIYFGGSTEEADGPPNYTYIKMLYPKLINDATTTTYKPNALGFGAGI